MNATDSEYMGMALEAARRALLAGEVPVGACLVSGDARIAGHNHVIAHCDPTAHAEMEVIREAARRWRAWPAAGLRLFATVEPCPMCLAACHYAGIAEVLYAASLGDFHRLTGSELLAPLSSPVQVSGGLRRADSLQLLELWKARRAATA